MSKEDSRPLCWELILWLSLQKGKRQQESEDDDWWEAEEDELEENVTKKRTSVVERK